MTTSEITYRQAEFTDLPSFVDLRRNNWTTDETARRQEGSIPRHSPVWDSDAAMHDYLGGLQTALGAGDHIALAFQETTLVGGLHGVVVSDLNLASVYSLDVLPKMRRRNIGSLLLKDFISAAGKEIPIRLIVSPSNVAARALYTQCGFREVSENSMIKQSEAA